MKHEAEEQLLKTFNGQLKEMPAVAKTMVHQYQTSAIVLSIVCGILFILTLIGTIWLAAFFYKKHENSDDFCDDNDTACIVTSVFGASITITLAISMIVNIIHACTPITSLLGSILGN